MRHLTVLSLIFLVGCAGAPSLQSQAGLTDVSVRYHADGSLQSIDFIDGKQKASVKVKVDKTSGILEYEATEVEAFEAFKSRAEVEKAVTDTFGGIFDADGLNAITALLVELSDL